MDVRPEGRPCLEGIARAWKPVAFAIPMFTSIEEDVNTRLSGNILVPCETEQALKMGHAMVFVGYEDHEDFAGGGYFIVRNSWEIAGEHNARSAQVMGRSLTVLSNDTHTVRWSWSLDREVVLTLSTRAKELEG